jgi:hypothetical protein
MSNQRAIMALRKQAMEALRESTTMFDVAFSLLEQGNREEAVRLQNEARAKRNDSVWLMAKANALELAASGNVSSWHYEANRSVTLPH